MSVETVDECPKCGVKANGKYAMSPDGTFLCFYCGSVSVETCEKCNTPVMKRRIPFGKVGTLEIETCEHLATQMCVKYANSKAPESDCEELR